MAGKFEAPRQNRPFPKALLVLALLAALLLAALLLLRPQQARTPPSLPPETTAETAATLPPVQTAETTLPPETTLPQPELLCSATIGAQGDDHVATMYRSRE